MGNISSLRNPLLPPFAASHGHWISDLRFVKRCIRRFERHQVDFGWAVNFDAFKAIYKPPTTERGGMAYFISEAEYKQVWSIWDPGSHGRTDVLQIFAGAILCSRGEFDEKVSMLFELFDLNLDRSITRDEMTILVRAALSGWCRMIGAAVPDADELTQIARLAFKSADRQERTDARISLRELILWSHITAECLEILGRFNTTDIEAIRSNQGITAGAASASASAAAGAGANSAAASSSTSPSAASGAGNGSGTGSTSAIEDTAAAADGADARRSSGSSKHTFSGLSSGLLGGGTQNLSAQVDEAAVRERELLKLKPSIPTIQELTVREEGKKAAARKRLEMRILSSPRHVNAVSNQPRENHNTGAAAASASAAAAAGTSSAAASASSSAPASARNSADSSPTPPAPLPRWHKRIGDMVFLRQNFAACEIAGSGVPIDSAEAQNGSGGGGGSSGSTLKMPPIMSRRKSDITSLTAAAASANHRPTVPCSGYCALVVFGARMKAHGGRWKRLPQFLTQAGPIQAGEGLSFRDVLRSYFTEYAITKRELDAMVRASEEREAEALCPPKVALASSIEPIAMMIGGGAPASPTQRPQQPMHSHSQSQPFFASSPSSAAGSGVMLSPLSGSLSAGSPSSSSSAASPSSAAAAPSGSVPPVSRALVLKLAQVFDAQDNDAESGASSGRVSLSALMAILGTSKKLGDLIDLQRVQAQLNQPIAVTAAAAAAATSNGHAQGRGHGRAPSLPALSSSVSSAASPSASASVSAASAVPTHSTRQVSLPELLDFLFRSSAHASQLPEMQSWVLPLPAPLSPARRADVRRAFLRADRGEVGSIAVDDLAAALQEAHANQGPSFTEQQMQFWIAPFQPQPQPQSGNGSSNGGTATAAKRRIDWVTFVRIVRSIAAENAAPGAGSPQSQFHPHPPTSPQQQQSSSGSLKSRSSLPTSPA